MKKFHLIYPNNSAIAVEADFLPNTGDALTINDKIYLVVRLHHVFKYSHLKNRHAAVAEVHIQLLD